jgi:hypothetical protein
MWKGKLAALYLSHEELVKEMLSRKYHHKTELDRKYATGYSSQNQFVNTYDEQINILKNKGCKCKI